MLLCCATLLLLARLNFVLCIDSMDFNNRPGIMCSFLFIASILRFWLQVVICDCFSVYVLSVINVQNFEYLSQ